VLASELLLTHCGPCRRQWRRRPASQSQSFTLSSAPLAAKARARASRSHPVLSSPARLWRREQELEAHTALCCGACGADTSFQLRHSTVYCPTVGGRGGWWVGDGMMGHGHGFNGFVQARLAVPVQRLARLHHLHRCVDCGRRLCCSQPPQLISHTAKGRCLQRSWRMFIPASRCHRPLQGLHGRRSALWTPPEPFTVNPKRLPLGLRGPVEPLEVVGAVNPTRPAISARTFAARLWHCDAVAVAECTACRGCAAACVMRSAP
jgi:hypothetical protein